MSGNTKKPLLPFRSRDTVDPLFQKVLRSFLKTGRYLDLGCNIATNALYAARLDWYVEACDSDGDAITIARSSIATLNLRNAFFFHQCLQDFLRTASYTYDLVSSLDVLTFVPPDDMPDVLAHINRVVKPRGEVLLRVFTMLEATVTREPNRTFFADGQLAETFPGFTILEDRQQLVQDPGHQSRPEPHSHHVEIFHAKKR